MNDFSDPDPQDEADQAGQEPFSRPKSEIYTDERIQEFLSEDAPPIEPEIYTVDRDFQASQQGTEERLAPVHPGEILLEEFLEPLDLTAADLAERLRMPAESVESLARSEQPITADDALRLARYFNTTPHFWLNLQAQHDLEVTRARISHELAAITPHVGNSDA